MRLLHFGNVKNADKAIEKLEGAREEHDGNLALFIKSAPEFGFMHHDPRFIELMHRLGIVAWLRNNMPVGP